MPEFSQQKKFFIAFIIVVIIFVGYWVFDALYSRSVASPHEIANTSVATSSPFFGSALTNGQGNFFASSTPSNLTQDAIKDISKDLISSLQGASSTSKEDLLSKLQQSRSSALSAETLSAYATPDKLGLVQNIPDSEVSISDDSSVSAVATYKQAYANAIKPLAQLVAGADVQAALNAFMKDNNTEDLDNLIKTYDTIYGALRTIQVPRGLVSFHKDNMTFFANEQIVFVGIRGYKDDPLRAYLLGEQLTSLSGVWQNILNQYQNL